MAHADAGVTKTDEDSILTKIQNFCNLKGHFEILCAKWCKKAASTEHWRRAFFFILGWLIFIIPHFCRFQWCLAKLLAITFWPLRGHKSNISSCAGSYCSCPRCYHSNRNGFVGVICGQEHIVIQKTLRIVINTTVQCFIISTTFYWRNTRLSL